MPREPPIAVLFEDIPGLYFTVAQRLPGPRMSLSVFFHPMNPSETTFLERPRWRGAVMSFKKKRIRRMNQYDEPQLWKVEL